MNLEDDLLQSYFTEKDIKGLTHEQFQIAMLGLIEKGLMEMKEVDGKRMYRPTHLARKIKTHLHSEEKDRN
jgi:hypothetical protein